MIQINISNSFFDKELSTAPLYIKKSLVKARRATKTETVTTVLKNGIVETTNKAQTGDFIITNPSGENYIIDEKTFKKRYAPTSRPDVYQARGIIRAIPNPKKTNISIKAPWGETQFEDENCMIAVVCDGKTFQATEDRYLISRDEFNQTYKKKDDTIDMSF